MARGRRPLPTAVKKLHGERRPSRINGAEPTPASGEPQMPPHLSAIAQQEWRSIVPELLLLKVLSVIDGKALAAYCMAYADWIAWEAELEKYGRMVEEPIVNAEGDVVGEKLKANPAAARRDAAMKMMRAFLIEFGMTPAARSRIRIEKPKDADPMEEYLSGKQPSKAHVN